MKALIVNCTLVLAGIVVWSIACDGISAWRKGRAEREARRLRFDVGGILK